MAARLVSEGRWCRINSELLNDYRVQRLSHKQFRREFERAMRGEESAFADLVRGPYNRPLAHEWRALREAVFLRDDFTCQYCGARGVSLECDHIVAVSRGGSSDPDNLTTACRPCNRQKRNKSLDEWSGVAGLV